MSNRAEEAAMKAYPTKYREIPIGYSVPINKYVTERACFVQGYEQAEKDLALTWEDIRTICLLTIGAEIVRDKPDLADNVQEKLEQVFYEDVLRRFRETKDK